MLGDMLVLGGGPRRVEAIAGVAGRRSWPAHEKLRIVEESPGSPGGSIFAVARRNGVAPNLLFRWRRPMAEGGAMAVGSNEPVVVASEVRRLEEKVRELERQSGRKTMEAEILKEVLAKGGSKESGLAAAVAAQGGFPVSAVARTIGASRSRLHAQPLPQGPRRRAAARDPPARR